MPSATTSDVRALYAARVLLFKGESYVRVPSILQGKSLTQIWQGIVTGAVATLVVGFYWGGWVTNG
jgi:hypothetical protein